MARAIPLIIIWGTFLILSLMSSHRERHLQNYIRANPTQRLKHFKRFEAKLPSEEKNNLRLWESLITGNSRLIDKDVRAKYQDLGLVHLFTPSGFHLSAILGPLKILIKSKNLQFLLLILIAVYCFTLVQGQEALKRMSLIKLHQHISGQTVGFLLAILCDILRGGLFNSPLSFIYSLLFLSFIYLKCKNLLWWFFVGQCLIVYFQDRTISILNLIFGPIINFFFSLFLPPLMMFAIPSTDLPLRWGIKGIHTLNRVVSAFYEISEHFTKIEVTLIFLLMITAIHLRKKKWIYLCLVFYHSNLNIDLTDEKFNSTWEIVYEKNLEEKYCERELIRGMWWEKCSPRKRSTIKNLN